MNSLIAFVFAVTLMCSAVSAGPYLPPYYGYRPYGSLRSYYYGAAAPVAPVAPVPGAGPAPVAPLLSDYYSYAAAAALSYPYGYPYNFNYLGAYTGYPYLKK